MKKYLFLIIASISTTFAQNNVIGYNDLKINSTSLNLSKNQFLKELSIPTNFTNYVNELINENFENYQKNDNHFYFKNQQLEDFSLNDATFSFIHDAIRVGNSISEVQPYFSNSFANKEFNDNLGFIILNLKLPYGTAADDFIVINYNIQQIITSIHFGEY